jgi:hypothetical protein
MKDIEGGRCDMGHKNAFGLKLMLGVALMLAVGLLIASTRPVEAPAPVALTPQDEILIYQAVIQSISPPNSSGPRYVLRTTDEHAAQPPPHTGVANVVNLSTATQASISAALGNIIWVDSFEKVPRDPINGTVVQGGIFITLGNISVQQEQQVKTSASYFAGPIWGGGYLYTLNWANGVWSISSALTTWIS